MNFIWCIKNVILNQHGEVILTWFYVSSSYTWKTQKIQKHVFYLRIMVRHVERVIVMEYDPNFCWEWPTHYNCFLIVLHLTNWKVTLAIHTLERYMKSQRDGEIISNFLCHEHILITGDDRGHSDWGCYVSLGWMIISLCFIL